MAVPAFNIDGVLPPFTGDNPGGSPESMSPHKATCEEVVQRFGFTDRRRELLEKWLLHRQEMRRVGIVHGFQWLNGSFVEDKTPNDIDIVTFLRRPQGIYSPFAFGQFMSNNQRIFRRRLVFELYGIDAFFLDLESDPDKLVSMSRYYVLLFSHQRSTLLWKGLLEVRLDDPAGDAAAFQALADARPTGGAP